VITIERIFLEIRNLDPADLDRWIAEQYIRPEGEPGAWRFQEIDVARIRLIIELRDTLEITEPALPTVLSLLDQLYELRRQMRQLNAAMEATLPVEMRAALIGRLGA
jgi:chaperone modulatory protein CbpM